VDKKSLLGLALIALIMGVWLFMSGPSKEQIARNRTVRDSIETVERQKRADEALRIAAADTTRIQEKIEAVVPDSVVQAERSGNYRDFLPATAGTATVYTIENDLLKIHVNSKGGYISKVELKNYRRPGSDAPLELFGPDSTRFALILNAYDRSRIFHTDSFYFAPVSMDGSSITMRLQTAKKGSYLQFSYKLQPGTYLVQSNLTLHGMQDIVSQTEDQLQLQWRMNLPGQEKHIVKERDAATIYYKQLINDPDYINPAKDEKKEINEDDIKWICFKQQFFNASIIAENSFSKAGSYVKCSLRNSPDVVKATETELGIPFGHHEDENFAMNYYFGPNHYNTLKAVGHDLEQIIPTGWSIFSYINKWLVIPLFNVLDNVNMGIVILILTIIVKIVLLPIAYKTYMSGARMRLLKPETDALNAKYEKNPDPMKKQQEQMGLYKKAGVNPLSGCIPVLLQFPILIALFNFVPAAIELRQKPFLWADDLSTYDSIWTFGEVPFINSVYGDHVSLFAALMFVSTIVYTYMNSSMMPQQSNTQMPGMKFMMYFMPVIFLAVMNSYSAGLSWYYFLANMLTFVQNFIIRRFVSDASIRSQLEANMKKPAKVSTFQKRLEEMAKQRQQAGKKR
jgi:YidC/Oxa1 family membrane protein insertase